MNDFNSRAPQNLKTFARMFWIRVSCPSDNFFYAGGNNFFRAWRRAAMRAAWFERDVKGRAARIEIVFFCVEQRLDFRVRQTRAPMPAAPDDFAAFDQHRADHRIRRSRAAAAPGEPEGEAHEKGVIHQLCAG